MSTKSRWVGSIEEFYESAAPQETVRRMSRLTTYDDFLYPSLVIPDSGSLESGVGWCKKIVAAGGAPTVALVADAVGGQVQCALDATNEVQHAILNWGDHKAVDVTQGAVFEARFQLSVLPAAAAATTLIGLASDYTTPFANNTCYIQVAANGSGALLARSFDGVTTTSAALGKTLLTTDWATCRIDCTDVTDCKILINGEQLTTAGQINFAATSTLAVLQPYCGMTKTANAALGTVLIDYIKIWQNRA